LRPSSHHSAAKGEAFFMFYFIPERLHVTQYAHIIKISRKENRRNHDDGGAGEDRESAYYGILWLIQPGREREREIKTEAENT
jgi:hypothetical protein